MSEKSILAYFKSMEEALQAADRLKTLGITGVKIDRFDKYPEGGGGGPVNPLTGEVGWLTALTLRADVTTRDAGVLMAVDPTAAGMSDGGPTAVTGRDILLTAVVDEALHEQALHVVRKAGGMV